ncbi:MAG: GHKL domain-containing protein [Desulfobacterales bacterium]|nr:GHKL domain-containing protein [Desulfobacterales bacterium]
MILRKLADHYCGVYLIRVLEGFIHNLNNPLQILCVRSEQLTKNIEKLREALEAEAVAEARELIEPMESKIDSFATSLEGLYSGLGSLTRCVLFKECSEIGQVKINAVVEDTLFLLNANMFFKHSVEKTLELDDNLPTLRGRHTDLCIIMLNLIQNALESMAGAEEKHLTIETSVQEANIIIKVGDTGCGIPEENRQHIFKAFFTTKRGTQYEGKLDEHLGIGLSLVSFLLEDYLGHISFESVPGNTTFTLELET